jgi:hypothetical protein
MTSKLELDCALMAGGAYVSNRSDKNQFPVPSGWYQIPLSHFSDKGTRCEESGMKAARNPLERLVQVVLILMMGFGMSGCSRTTWKEEVLLHDGSKIVVKRSQSRGGRHEIGQSAPIKEHSIEFTVPGYWQRIIWHDEYSNEICHSNFDLLALHILNGTPYLVTVPFGCLSFNKWGRPNPPYVIFKHNGNMWTRISLGELPAEFHSVNLVKDTDNDEKRLSGMDVVSSDQVKEFNSDYTQPEYKTILREPVKGGDGLGACPDYNSQQYMSPKAPAPIPLQELPADINTPNLISSDPDNEAKKSGMEVVSAEFIKQWTSGFSQPEYKAIVREPVIKQGPEGCREEIYNGHGTWFSRDWFTSQPSYEACINFCKTENFSDQVCPCNSIFKRK